MHLPQDIGIKKIKEFTGHTAAIYKIIAGKDDHTFISAGGDGIVAEWNTENDDIGKALAKVNSSIFSICQIPGTSLIAVGQLDGTLQIFDLETASEFIQIFTEPHAIYAVICHHNFLFAASGNGKVWVYATETFRLITTLGLSDKNIRCFEIADDIVFAGCSDAKIYAIHLPQFSVTEIVSGHTNSVFSLLYLPESKKLITGSRDAQLGIMDISHNYKQLQCIPAHLNTINHIAVNAAHSLLATASRDKTIRIWDAQHFTLLKAIDARHQGHLNSVNNVFWTADNKFLISCGDDRKIMLWEITINK